MKKGHTLLERAKIDENKKNTTFMIFSGEYGKMSQKVKNNEKGFSIAEKVQKLMKNKEHNIC